MDTIPNRLLLISTRPYPQLERLLADLGYETQAIPALSAAADALNSVIFDLILLDAALATAEFAHFAAALRQSQPALRPPIVLIGGAADLPAIKRGLAQGADDYLLELDDPDLIQARLAAALERGRLRETAVYQFEAFNEMERLADDLKLRILPLGIALSAEKDFDRLLEQIVFEARAICHADASLLFMRDNDQLQLAAFHVESLHIAQVGREIVPPFPPIFLYSQVSDQPSQDNLIAHVALQGNSVNIADLYQMDVFDLDGMRQWDAASGYRSISCLTVPLKNHHSEVIGVLQLVNSQEPQTGELLPFDLYHQLVVESLASQAAVALNTQILLRREQSLLELEREMAIGRQIQSSFLPDHVPAMPGWEFAVSFQPAFDVAGDFYDIFPLANHRVGFVVADICGKGVGAALFMALVRSLVRAFSQQNYLLEKWESVTAPRLPIGRPIASDAGEPLTQTILLTNNYLVHNHLQAGMFATLFLGLLDTESGYMTYVNCGHNPPVVLRSDGRQIRLPPTGPALGVTAAVPFAAARLILDPGDLLFAFTDGVIDARDERRAFFGESRLLAGLRLAMPAAELIAQFQAALQAHMTDAPQADDITMLALRRE